MNARELGGLYMPLKAKKRRISTANRIFAGKELA
jgi:hypothetical protein